VLFLRTRRSLKTKEIYLGAGGNTRDQPEEPSERKENWEPQGKQNARKGPWEKLPREFGPRETEIRVVHHKPAVARSTLWVKKQVSEAVGGTGRGWEGMGGTSERRNGNRSFTGSRRGINQYKHWV